LLAPLSPMSAPEPSIYEQRVSSGAYTQLINNLQILESRALISVEYKRDFYQEGKRGFLTVPSGDGSVRPFKTWLFGEIAPRAAGTLHQASGNHYFGKRPVSLCVSSPTPF